MAEDDIDTGADISLVEYMEIVHIPFLMLSKPLEIGVTGHREKGVVVEYSATHYLPSTQYEREMPTGSALVGRGKTPEAAGICLGNIIGELWAKLKNTPREELGPEVQLQKQYLSTLFLE